MIASVYTCRLYIDYWLKANTDHVAYWLGGPLHDQEVVGLKPDWILPKTFTKWHIRPSCLVLCIKKKGVVSKYMELPVD